MTLTLREAQLFAGVASQDTEPSSRGPEEGPCVFYSLPAKPIKEHPKPNP